MVHSNTTDYLYMSKYYELTTDVVGKMKNTRSYVIQTFCINSFSPYVIKAVALRGFTLGTVNNNRKIVKMNLADSKLLDPKLWDWSIFSGIEEERENTLNNDKNTVGFFFMNRLGGM